MKPVCESADDDRRPIDGDLIEGRRGEHFLLSDDLGRFVVVARLLAQVEFGLQHAPAAAAANVGRGNVVALANAGPLAQADHVSCPLHIAAGRFAGSFVGVKGQRGGRVNDRAAAGTDPSDVRIGKSQRGLSDVSLEHHGPHQRATEFLLPMRHGGFDALHGRLTLRRTHDHGQRYAGPPSSRAAGNGLIDRLRQLKVGTPWENSCPNRLGGIRFAVASGCLTVALNPVLRRITREPPNRRRRSAFRLGSCRTAGWPGTTRRPPRRPW